MLPPNARKIKTARDIGQHPADVHLVYTGRWCSSQYRPGAVLVMADEYKRGEYSSFAWLAGLPVALFNHDQPIDDFLSLAADVASWTAPVFMGPFPNRPNNAAEVDEVMFCLRWSKPGEMWPPQWSDEQARAYAQRCQRADYVRERREQGQRA